MVEPPAANTGYYHWQGKDLLLQILVQPKGGKDEIVGPYGKELKVRLKAPPVDGQANQALVKFFCKLFKVPQSQVHILSGELSRHKRLRIESPKTLPPGIRAA
ncbi:MAG: hypothetical protein AMJ53_11235 [Gammaproteobacteria bacterium SG8_11]|nr:MAG: hypothetical protein AMJ53_11235 [Gammaproteobacteria bacterium SG8_11]